MVNKADWIKVAEVGQVSKSLRYTTIGIWSSPFLKGPQSSRSQASLLNGETYWKFHLNLRRLKFGA